MGADTPSLVSSTTLALCSLGCVLGSLSSEWFPPLPSFRKVSVRTTSNYTTVTINYGAPERPRVQWFVGDVPVPTALSRGHTTINSFELGGWLFLSTSQMDRAISVCLHNTVASACLRLRPQQQDMAEKVQDLEFPWPLVVPAPTVRYDPGHPARLFLPALTTGHNYTYSSLLLAHSSSLPFPRLRQLASQRDAMEGGHGGPVVTLSPVTSGSDGWLMEVATDTLDLEGVLLLKTHFVMESDLVESCTTTRPISIYRRGNSAPFPRGFVATVTRGDFVTLPWVCREGAFCLITCPFVSNGDVTMSLSRRRNGSSVTEELPMPSMFAEEWRSGEYYGQARFLLEDVFRNSTDSGTYKCTIATANGTAFLEANLVAG